MATILNTNVNRAIDVNGFSVPGAKATFYNSGTTSIRTVYTDPETSIPHASPVVANGAGVFPPIYDTGAGDVKVEVTDANGVMLAGYPVDPCLRVTTDVTGASSVQFDPTAEIPVTDVQAAIERVQENIVAPLAEFGIGVTGNAGLIADIDATGTASGIYRFDGTTAGSFPAGVIPSGAGIATLWRETSGDVFMSISQSGDSRQYVRDLKDSSWGAWSYNMRNTDTESDAVWAAGTSNATRTVTPANVMAAVSAQAIGVNQTWQDVTGSRGLGNVYTNSTGRPICVFIVGDDLFQWSIRPPGGVFMTTADLDSDGSDTDNVFSFLVPDGHDYRMTGGGGAIKKNWWELR